MKAGEKVEILVEFNFWRRGVTKDWSVTAWGEKGEVKVWHKKGIESDNWSFTPIKHQFSQETLENRKAKKVKNAKDKMQETDDRIKEYEEQIKQREIAK